MASRVIAALAGCLIASLALLTGVPEDAGAEQRLANGGFEGTTSGWNGIGLSAAGCTPHSGGGALSLSASSAQTIFAQQTVNGPFGAGTHVFSGFYQVATGAPSSITVSLIWNTTGGQIPRTQTFGNSAAYASFSILDSNPPTSASSVVVKVTVISNAAVVFCLDDLSFEAPPAPPPTPLPTSTSTPTPTATAIVLPSATSFVPAAATSTSVPDVATPTATATATMIGASTATVTRTPSAQSSSTATSGTATPSASSTAVTAAPAPGLVFVNGGFEEGLRGWQRYGGDLASGAGGRNGTSAGLLTSASNSTKWAYQVVAIDPAKAYEFNGFLRGGGGVKSAYLRISWYDSADGGGKAISTDDSGGKLTSASDAYSYFSTGGIAPPASARSARLRVMLTPNGADTATLHLDDFQFFQTTATKKASTTSDPDEPFETAAATATPRPADATATAQARVETGSTIEDATNEARTSPVAGTAVSGSSAGGRTESAPRASSARSTSTPKPGAATLVEARNVASKDGGKGEAGGTSALSRPEAGAPSAPDDGGPGKGTLVALGIIALGLSAGGAYITSKRQS